jgi:hypothetical protein
MERVNYWFGFKFNIISINFLVQSNKHGINGNYCYNIYYWAILIKPYRCGISIDASLLSYFSIIKVLNSGIIYPLV